MKTIDLSQDGLVSYLLDSKKINTWCDEYSINIQLKRVPDDPQKHYLEFDTEENAVFFKLIWCLND